MAIFPLDIIEDILSRLPVKSLKCFRTVAKSWCSLIDSEHFIKLHLRQSLISNSNHNLILVGNSLFTVDLGSLDMALVIDPPFEYNAVDGLSNSCDGLVLVMSEPPVMWNPFARSYRVLPSSSMELPPGSDFYLLFSYGLGYDSKIDDHKVLKIVEFLNESNHATVHTETAIYSMKSNSWKKIEDFPYELQYLECHLRAHVNGSFHTLSYTAENMCTIMAFSFETEKHYEVMPPTCIGNRYIDFGIDVVRGCLCLICRNSSRLVVWVMKEYGVEESWSRLLKIRSPAIELHVSVRPLFYSNDGNKVLLNCDDRRLVLYDLKTKTVEEIHLDGIPLHFHTQVCVESLVSVESPIEVKKHDKEEKKEKETRKNPKNR